MVHEARHVWQGLQPLAFDIDLQVKPFFMMGFAIEADAVATETMFAFDLRKSRPEIWDSLKKAITEKSPTPLKTESNLQKE